MSEQPRCWVEFLVRFGCAFVVFGAVLGLVVSRYFGDLPWGQFGLLWGAATTVTSVIAAWVGDAFWRDAARYLPWW